MATPQPQAGTGFPRRTTDQPALPNRPAEGGEKDLKQTDDRNRPTPPRGSRAEDDDRQAEDWGLADARPRMSLSKKIVLALGLAAVAGGGVYGYVYHFPKSGETASAAGDLASENGVTEGAPEGGIVAQNNAPMESDDPFADPRPGRPRAVGNQGGSPELVPVPNQDEPEVALSGPATTRSIAPKRSLSDLELDLEMDANDASARSSNPPSLGQSEPESPELLTLDARPAARPRIPAMRADDPDTSEPTVPANTRVARPLANSSAPSSDDPFAGKLDGYTIAEDRPSGAAPARSRGVAADPEIGIVEADDPQDARLNGFTVQDDLSRRRAVSRTVVTRAPAGMAARSSGARLTAGFDGPAEDGLAGTAPIPPAPGSAASPSIPQRGSPPTAATFEFTPPGAESRTAVAPAIPGEIYTIAPNDNYWTISRKQYGTSKYFMALSRHNATRIPDPHRMRPGMKVETPPPEVLEQRYPDLIEKSPRVVRRPVVDDGIPHFGDSPEEAPPAPGSSRRGTAGDGPAGYFVDRGGAPLYRVGSDDTLSGIAQRHLGRASRWLEVYELNRNVVKSPEALTIGTVIRLPDDASRLSLVPDTEPRR